MSDQPCPFCDPRPAERIFYEDELTWGIWDGFPVSPGHEVAGNGEGAREGGLLLGGGVEPGGDVPPRGEQRVAGRYSPEGYNIGINVGRAAGQTVFHLHVHLTPRYSGDVADPLGGVCHVIPSKGNYLLGGDPGTVNAPGEPRRRALVSGGPPFPCRPGRRRNAPGVVRDMPLQQTAHFTEAAT
jgi:ATP adenylyltransferase